MSTQELENWDFFFWGEIHVRKTSDELASEAVRRGTRIVLKTRRGVAAARAPTGPPAPSVSYLRLTTELASLDACSDEQLVVSSFLPLVDLNL
jgi:hypothetical protein